MAVARVIPAVVDRLTQNRPLMGAIVEGIRAAADSPNTAIQPADVPRVQQEVVAAIAASPVARSAVSAEPWWENRVKVGLYIVGVGAILKLFDFPASSWFEENKETITTIVIAFGGSVAALGEWLSAWLSGIDWRRPWTILGIGRRVRD